jgi:CheY-like chemotaxis protein
MQKDNIMITEPLTILMAEDDAGHATLVQLNLKRAGCINDIFHVPDGQQALDFLHCQGAFADRRPAGPLLLLLDINMPCVNGIEVLHQVRQDHSMKDLPIIMLTTTDDPQEIERCYQIGCNVYITKPVSYEAFAKAVQRLGMFLQIVQVPSEHQVRKE